MTAVIRYVERDPVRAGMVERAERYPWSSAAVHLEMREDARGLLDLGATRVVAPEIPYHVTQRGTNRQPVFFTVADRKLYLQLIRENLCDAGVRVLAYCLMTNHVHFIAVPEREDSLAILFGRAHGRYSQALNIRRSRCGHLWQARFHSCPMSPAHLEVGLRYVEANPCRAGIVARPEQYRWSSAAAHLLAEGDSSGVLDRGYWERAGGVETWAELHARRENLEAILELRKCTYAGRPFGDAAFVDEMEQRFQRKWLRRRRTGVGIGEISVR